MLTDTVAPFSPTVHPAAAAAGEVVRAPPARRRRWPSAAPPFARVRRVPSTLDAARRAHRACTFPRLFQRVVYSSRVCAFLVAFSAAAFSASVRVGVRPSLGALALREVRIEGGEVRLEVREEEETRDAGPERGEAHDGAEVRRGGFGRVEERSEERAGDAGLDGGVRVAERATDERHHLRGGAAEGPGPRPGSRRGVSPPCRTIPASS